MKNVIFSYTQTSEISEENQALTAKVPYGEMPASDMPQKVVVITPATDVAPEVSQTTKYFQANVSSIEELEYLKSILQQSGLVAIIGIWNKDGSIYDANFDINAYRDALGINQIWEEHDHINGVDYHGKLDTYIPKKDEEGIEIPYSVIKKFVLVKAKPYTLAEARLMQVNSFEFNPFRQIK